MRTLTVKIKVTDQGVLIPKELLGDSQEVEVIQEAEKIIITTQKKTLSIWDLGQNPVECDVTDAAKNHDKYLYHR
jgi:virulence-associated protein VagC